jgi:hypothetical protein
MRRIVLISFLVTLFSSTLHGQVIVRHTEPTPTGYYADGFSDNLFGSSTGCRINIPDSALVSIRIYDANGKDVFSSPSTEVCPGVYGVGWDGKDSIGRMVSNGLYLLEVSVVSIGHEARNREILFRAKGRVFLYRD